ncbi:MAG: LptF/LptG family permease, partial [Treponema sp.]|nr:LptF/LptG family permease [Treponema sp.]
MRNLFSGFGRRNRAAAAGMESHRSLSPTIYRYILKEALFTFSACFLFFFVIFVFNQLILMAQDILTKRVPAGQVALLLLFALPGIISLSAPFACLVGMLIAIGRLTSDNEILIMLASGLSFRNIFLPAVTVGVLVTLVSFFANDVLLPAGQVEYRRLYRRILLSTPALELAANSVKRFRDTIIVTGDVTDNAINNILILDRTGDGERRVIMAGNAELKDPGGNGLSLQMDRAFIHSSKELIREDYDYASAGSLFYWVSQEDIAQGIQSV